MRSQASALYLFVINLIGMGLGPWVVAALNDYLFGDPKAIGLSLLIVGVFSFLCAAILLWLGLKPYRRSLEYLKEWSSGLFEGMELDRCLSSTAHAKSPVDCQTACD